jgi:hypothetical protein
MPPPKPMTAATTIMTTTRILKFDLLALDFFIIYFYYKDLVPKDKENYIIKSSALLRTK